MKVVVKPGGQRGTKTYHLPTEDGKPKCGENGPTDREWVEKDVAVLPNSDVCDKCVNGRSGGCRGPMLSKKLRDMDASEVEL